MTIEELHKISSVLKEKFNNQHNVTFDEVAYDKNKEVVVSYETFCGELREIGLSIGELLQEYENLEVNKNIEEDNPLGSRSVNNSKMQEVLDNTPPKEITYEDIIWDGISRVRAWEGAGKKRLYFNVVGVSESLHKRGKVFVELVMGRWIPNMKYNLMVNFANQLNELEIEDAELVQEMYQHYLEMQ